MALIEGCKHSLEITVPVEEVRDEEQKVVGEIARKVRLPGFRPGKAPVSLVRQRFQSDIRKDVLDRLLPRAFHRQAEAEKLGVVGTPNVTEVHFHDGEPLRFTAEFEVAPDIELGQYKGLTVEYADPVVSDADIDGRIAALREQKADFVNEDPRPLREGDHAVVAMRSVAGVAEPVSQDELVLHLGDEDTLPAFTENLVGQSPGDEREFDVTYPDDYGSDKLAGRTVRFHLTVKGIRRKELPELNDEFAQDLGDYKTMEEVRDAVRNAIRRERETVAQQEAKERLIERLIETHTFPVPEAYVERQIENQLDQQLRRLSEQGIDPRQLKLDWSKVKESQRERALRNVQGSLLLEKVADTESIQALPEEVDREVQRFAKQQREPVAAVRMKFEKDGTLARIGAHIRTEKTLQLLFDQARKEAPAAAPEAEAS